MTTQFVVQLDNRPGSFAALTRALAERGVDLRSISGGGTGEHAYVVLPATDADAARAVLRTSGYPFVEGATIVVQVEGRPGGLAAVAEKLAAAGVDIRSVLFVGSAAGLVETAIAVDDIERAREVLGID